MSKLKKLFFQSQQAELEKLFSIVEKYPDRFDSNTGHFRKNYFERIQDYFFLQDKLVRGSDERI